MAFVQSDAVSKVSSNFCLSKQCTSSSSCFQQQSNMQKSNKPKQYQVRVEDVQTWKQELEFHGLVVAEIFSPYFGPCEVLVPAINNIMEKVTDAPDRIKWVVVSPLQKALHNLLLAS